MHARSDESSGLETGRSANGRSDCRPCVIHIRVCVRIRVRARPWRQCGSREFACEIHSLSSPLSVALCRSACLSLSAVPYLWSFPYDALGSELRRAPIYTTSEETAPNLDRFTFKQVR